VKTRKRRKPKTKRGTRDRVLENIGLPKDVARLITIYAGPIPNKPRRVRACDYCGQDWGHSNGCLFKPKGYIRSPNPMLVSTEKAKNIKMNFDRQSTLKMYWFGDDFMTPGDFSEKVVKTTPDDTFYRLAQVLYDTMRYVSVSVYNYVWGRVRASYTRHPVLINKRPNTEPSCPICGKPNPAYLQHLCYRLCPWRGRSASVTHAELMTETERLHRLRTFTENVTRCLQEYEKEYYQ